MRQVKATSRCEVSGKVYMPGDHMFVTEEQFTYLKEQRAAIDHPDPITCVGHDMDVTPPPVNATLKERDDFVTRWKRKSKTKE